MAVKLSVCGKADDVVPDETYIESLSRFGSPCGCLYVIIWKCVGALNGFSRICSEFGVELIKSDSSVGLFGGEFILGGVGGFAIVLDCDIDEVDGSSGD